MLRADNVICGTSTTGTGTLTLAACPAPPGGLDFYNWLTTTGIGFTNGNAILVSYTIIEYTSSSFSTAKQTEKGVGTLTLGASLTATTLARTTVQSTVTGMNTTPVMTVSSPTAITIGVAANTLVFVGASASDVISTSPYLDVTTNNRGFPPLQSVAASTNACILGSGLETYTFFIWPTTLIAKRIVMTTGATSAYSGGTSNLYGRLYAIGTNGRPGKLLIDFGVLGTANSSFATGNTVVQSAAATNGFLMTPGAYVLSTLAIFSGGSGTPSLYSNPGQLHPGNTGYDGSFITFTGPIAMTQSTGGNAVAPDPANLSAYVAGSSGPDPISFALKTS
jgi:hypothetical protein